MGVLFWLVAGLYCNVVLAEVIFYDAYTTAVITPAEKASQDAQGLSFWCVNEFESCSATEGRRFDGSCNNLKNPAAGAGRSKFERLLPSYYAYNDGLNPYYNADDYALPSPREVRTTMVADGTGSGDEITQLGVLFPAFVTIDFSASTAFDLTFYLANLTTCCTAAGADNPLCNPINVPEDDALSLVAGITCLNLTKPTSFQSKNCIYQDITPPERINSGAANLDLKPVYGSDPRTSLVRQRLFKGGLFNYSLAGDGLQWPESQTAIPADGMAANKGHPFLMALVFWREHNRIANELSKLNPSWNDAKLFETAREINIAQYAQIFYYESIANLLGYDNLVRDGILLESDGFRDIYDENVLPGWWTETLFAYRWFHSILNSDLERYTLDGDFFDEDKVSLTFPPARWQQGHNISYFIQGLFRTSTAKSDDRFDSFLGEKALGVTSSQRAFDLGSIDIAKGRAQGVAPYVDVLNFCDGNNYESFESLEGHLSEDAIEKLKDLYQTGEVADIELLPAMWREYHYPGSKVAMTVYCLITKQLLRNIQSDRHWYERPNRPNAFTAAQLAEVRKASISRILCDNTVSVTKTGITARSFQPISDENPLVACNTLPVVDLTAWKQN